MRAKPIRNFCKVEDTQGDHQPYGKHEFHSIADQQRAEKISFNKAKKKRKKNK